VTPREPAHRRLAHVRVAGLEQFCQHGLRATARAQQRADLRLSGTIALLVLERGADRRNRTRVADLAERPRRLEPHVVVIIRQRVDQASRGLLRIELA